MCLIAIKQRNVDLPKEEYLRQANTRNNDGIGIMYMKDMDSEIHIKKDFANIDVFLSWIKENIKKEDICVIHFRLATHGLKDNGNRHPFPITKNKELLRKEELVCQMAVVHNGVLRQYGQHVKYSDTQKFILDILAEDSVKNNLKDRVIQKLVNSYLDGDRLAILDSEGTLYTYGEFHEFEGIRYSNNSYEKPKYELNWNKDWYKSKIGTTQATPEIAICDGCQEEKKVLEIEYEENILYLCKPCRKKLKKGTLGLVADLMADIVDDDGKIQCDSCYDIKDAKEVGEYQGSMFCFKCMGELMRTGYLPQKNYESWKGFNDTINLE